jgi:hypothetical protein
MAAQLWNPAELFAIVNPDRGHQTCLGWAPSKGRRCQIPIAAQNRETAKRILNQLALQRPSAMRMEVSLRQVASVCLCRRYHQDQVEEIITQWLQLVKRERRRCRWEDSTLMVRDANVLRTLWLSQLQHPTSNRQSQQTPSQSRLHVTSTISQPRMIQSPSATPQTTRVISRCRYRHAPRRSSDEDCSICSEPLANVPITELTWCKSTCGHNFHVACMEQWLQVGNRCVNWYVSILILDVLFSLQWLTILLLYSRGPWEPSCEHDASSPRFSIWTEEDIGLVKLFDLMSMFTERMGSWL